MATDLDGPVSLSARVPTFDRRRWQPSPKRLAAAGCVLAFACALAGQPMAGPGTGWMISGVLVLEVVVLLLPWGLPRDGRSSASFWAEALAGLAAPVGCLVIVLPAGAEWLHAGADWRWYAVAVTFGGALIWLSGLDVRSLARGELAFLLGPTPRSHTVARAGTSVAGPFGEEVLFRGAVLASASATALPLGLLAAVAFVARHHVSAGHNLRGSSRAMLVEMTAAAGFLTVTMLSGSIYPALVAHVINNLPVTVLHLQRVSAPASE